jgi:hypothetical protein
LSQADLPGPHPQVRLPAWNLVKASFASVFHHPDNFAGRAGPWVAVVAVLTALFGVVLGMEFEETGAATIVVSLAIGLGATMMVVSWHRGLLLGEPATAFRIDRPFWRYIGVCILLALLFGVAIGLLAAVVMLPASVGSSAEAIDAGVATLRLVAIAASIPLAARTMVALPMAAIDAAPPLIRGSWRLTRGNTWSLAGALLLTYVFGAAIQYLATIAVVLPFALMGAQDHAYLIVQPLGAALGLLLAALFASLASYAYAVLTGHPLGREVTG